MKPELYFIFVSLLIFFLIQTRLKESNFWLHIYSITRRNSSVRSGLDPSILRHSGIWGATDDAVLNKVHRKIKKIPL